MSLGRAALEKCGAPEQISRTEALVLQRVCLGRDRFQGLLEQEWHQQDDEKTDSLIRDMRKEQVWGEHAFFSFGAMHCGDFSRAKNKQRGIIIIINNNINNNNTFIGMCKDKTK